MDAERELELEIDAGRARYLFRKEHDLRVALEARVAELEAVLHDIASRTWNIQYETGVVRQTVRFASGLHDIARRAVEPPASKGESAK